MSATSPLGPGTSPSGGAPPSQNGAIALRVAIIGACLLVLFGVVFFRLWYLQILSGNSLAAQASRNHSRSTAITPPRGNITDRSGHIIVQNKRLQVMELAPGALPELERIDASDFGQRLGKWYLLTKAERKATPRPQLAALSDPKTVQAYTKDDAVDELHQLRTTYSRIGALLHLPATEIRRRVVTAYYLAPYANATIVKNVQPATVDYVDENRDRFPGVDITQRFARSYPLSGDGAQILGQVGPVPVDATTHKSTIAKYDKLNTATIVGTSGLEYEYNSELSGHEGSVQAKIDAQGNVVGTPSVVAPTSGDTLQTTIDSDLQKVAQDAIGGPKSVFNTGGSPGAVVAMDPTNGEILASASYPTFNPNQLANISQKQYALLNDPASNKPLFNRVIGAAYPAGSTFKPVTTFAALASHVDTPTEQIDDPGFIKISDHTYTNAKKEPNGEIALQRALQVSSDVYFYTMGARMNTVPGSPLQTWARRLGYGRTTGIDVPGESPGVIPDPAWRLRLDKLERACRIKNHIPLTPGTYGCKYSDMRTWSIGDEVGLAVGQGDLQITPLQSAVAYSAIENGGTIVTPHLGRRILDTSGQTIQYLSFKSRRHVTFDPTALATLRAGLSDAANKPGGTSYDVFKDWPKGKYPVYGKTGTAERGLGRPDQAWYAAYVPDSKHPIVVIATVETGGFGATTAAPIVAQVLKAWFHLGGVKISAGSSATY